MSQWTKLSGCTSSLLVELKYFPVEVHIHEVVILNTQVKLLPWTLFVWIFHNIIHFSQNKYM